jgi:hypothetical protein
MGSRFRPIGRAPGIARENSCGGTGCELASVKSGRVSYGQFSTNGRFVAYEVWFVAVSCGAIPDSLIEAELFGHEKGAFTGTVGTREGYFEQAGDGTLFLDEIGELKPQTQVKLLRVLQQREFCRLGSTRPIPLRARIVLATHRDLSQMVATGEFRQDLFYRVNVMNIAAPALRHHASDIPQLAQHFLQHYSQLYRKPIESIEPEALALLQSYSWPGRSTQSGSSESGIGAGSQRGLRTLTGWIPLCANTRPSPPSGSKRCPRYHAGFAKP